MRPSWRYVLIRIMASGRVLQDTFTKAFDQQIRHVIGEVGLAALRPQVLDFSAETGRAIIRCDSRHVMLLRFVLALTGSIGGEPCVLFSERTSGTLRSLRSLKPSG